MFIVILGTVLGLMHLYLWKRLVKDTTRGPRAVDTHGCPGRADGAAVRDADLLPRIFGLRESAWFAWPGYLWFGLVVYLFLTLLVLEPVRLALRPG